jgi:hypothetical protein
VENVAQSIREGWRPELTEAMKLPEQARRLDAAVKVAEEWMEVAREGTPEMWAQAQYTRDKLEEELSRVCFRMEVESENREFGEGSGSSAALSNALLEAYCILRDVPADLIGDGSPRARYALMGALMAAMDATGETEGKPEKASA